MCRAPALLRFRGVCCFLAAAEKVEAAAQQPTAAAPVQPPPAAAAKAPEEPLFVACRFFDRECTGYIEGEDLEEILFMVSDAISRERPFLLKLDAFLT